MKRNKKTSKDSAFVHWTAITGQTSNETGNMIDEFYKYHFHNIDKGIWRERWANQYNVSTDELFPIERELVEMLNN